MASFLAKDALFICIGGVNALHGLTDTIRELGVHEVVEAMDMDQMTNSNVRNAILAMRKEVQKIPGIRYAKYTWNPAYKGVDDYLLSRTETMLTEQEKVRIQAIIRKRQYGITLSQMKQFFKKHQHAREIGDKKTMEKIEYYLTDINFHYECGLLISGQYDKLSEVIKNW